ncbi:MAG: sulfur carrier protein ThiS [Victivallales bacterium]|nr:sulfur carrier protein ThiS [Victivallales bacterium]MBQ2335491.1 sulfur carrier protein ThiS [Victivallales bacterium]MBR3649206.1 sulfur carrier protein ThiS [Victivallales bacterium]
MSLTINGEQVEAAGKTLSDYLKEAGYDTRGIAVERNGEVIPRSRYDSTVLKDGDQVELVHCVAGG